MYIYMIIYTCIDIYIYICNSWMHVFTLRHYHCRVRGWFHGSVSATIKSESPLSTHKANVSDTFAPVEYIGKLLF